MNVDEQIQSLIENAPKDGTTPALVEAIAPVLKLLAGRLRHPQYYIVQTVEQEWAITILENREQPEISKTVVYAYPSLKDVAASPYPMNDPQMMALPMPVTHILFQMVAMEAIDSTIFFEVPDNLDIGTEIQRQDLNDLIHTHILQTQPTVSPLPPDIA